MTVDHTAGSAALDVTGLKRRFLDRTGLGLLGDEGLTIAEQVWPTFWAVWEEADGDVGRWEAELPTPESGAWSRLFAVAAGEGRALADCPTCGRRIWIGDQCIDCFSVTDDLTGNAWVDAWVDAWVAKAAVTDLAAEAHSVIRERGWVQGAFFGPDGYCLVGACELAADRLRAGYSRLSALYERLVTETHPDGHRGINDEMLKAWNDRRHRTQSDVLGLLERACGLDRDGRRVAA